MNDEWAQNGYRKTFTMTVPESDRATDRFSKPQPRLAEPIPYPLRASVALRAGKSLVSRPVNAVAMGTPIAP